MKRLFLLALAAASLALAAGVRYSLVFPPMSLPQGTGLALLDAKGKALWMSGQEGWGKALTQAVALEFKLPSGKVYAYPIAQRGKDLPSTEVRVGKRVYALATLLKNRHLTLGPRGELEAASGAASRSMGSGAKSGGTNR
ncbi:hypothetical protein YIM1640_19340 [Thermus oshimai]|jgi:hypothetical protein|uniref:hypothetical protein n=1 Tax=Thermus oshimai TaxID=56957 RepID=UPI0031FB0F49